MSLIDVSLDDKYDLSRSRVFLTGTQALVRMCLMQAEIDARAGLKTGGYVSGYRGSPLGALDQQFPRAARRLTEAGVVFEPGLNEDLAATAIWGTQQAELRGDGVGDGVFAMWYGKGPGVDRSGDVLRHGNLAGTSPHGGVLVLTGDDHTCESSTTAHQSEFALVDAMIPVLNPANIAELVAFGLHGWAMSRYSGAWVGLKAVKDNIESSGSVELPTRFAHATPTDFTMPEGGLNIRREDHPLQQEARLHRHKLDAVRAYARANGLNRIVTGDGPARLGIVAAGKAYMDVLQALEMLGLDVASAGAAGLSLLKIGMPYPLEPRIVEDFARGLHKIIVVEEKRGLIEDQLCRILYGSPVPVVGKHDEEGAELLPSEGAINPVQVAAAIGLRSDDARVVARGEEARAMMAADNAPELAARTPYFCAGCPHNSSTVLPRGARGYAGIGCHYMALFMDRGVEGYTHMGGEGTNWIGEARFSTRKHVFQNMGDGTYNHSGLQAIRAAVGAGVNITFKLLYNDAVAMTGGQAHDGGLDPYQIVREVLAFGASRVVYVSDDPARVDRTRLPSEVDVEPRANLDAVQQDLATTEGTTVLLYDQTCAAEKRRRRKRGLMEDPDRRVAINPRVCEGCGDCSQQSNCVAVVPLETEFGRKRAIDQSACNKDFSCLKGFCPSFVTIRNLGPGANAAPLPDIPDLPTASVREIAGTYNMALTGVGGTGVVTVGAILGMAAHLEGKGAGIIDMAGLAQKGGAVVSHIRIARDPGDISAIRIPRGGADLVLGCDLVTSAGDQIVASLNRKTGCAVVNSSQMMTGAFVLDPDFTLPVDLMMERVRRTLPEHNATFVDATAIARARLGNSIGANMFVLGVACQKGALPVGAQAIEKALEINGVEPEFNIAAFRLGRLWVVDAAQVEPAVRNTEPPTLEAFISRRGQDLVGYQSRRYARRYLRLVELARNADPAEAFTRAVARYGHKLFAYKDEYEVARHFNEAYLQGLRNAFGPEIRVSFHLASPGWSRKDRDGHPVKREFGPGTVRLFGLLRRLKFLRGTPFDPFGYSVERRQERALVADYEAMIRDLAARLGTIDYDTAVALASWPETLRGYGHVKAASLVRATAARDELRAQLKASRARAA